MNEKSLAERLPNNSFRFIDYGYLPNYIFRYRCRKIKSGQNKSSQNKTIGNIEPRIGSRVYGFVIDIDNSVINLLDKYEEFVHMDSKDNVYHKLFDMSIISYTTPNKTYKCYLYYMNPLIIDKNAIPKPSKEYVNRLYSSLQQIENPPKYHISRILSA
jgi:hypothetical protein